MENKALQMGKSSTAGSFFLLIGIVGSTVIMALGTMFLAGMLTDAELGLYGIVLIPSTTIAFFRDLGVNSAMTQKIANLRAANKSHEIHDVILSGIIFELISGILLSLICFAVAQPLALILNRPEASPLIALMSVSIFASTIVSASSSIFVGFEKMKLNSFAQILQALIKTLLGPLLVFLGFSVLGAVLGSIVSITAGGLISILLVYFVLFRPLRKLKVDKCDVKRTLTPMLKYGIPLTLSNIVVGVLPQIFAFFMALYVSDGIMGNYYAATYFSVLVTFISFPISTALFPAFSKLNPESEPELVKTVFSSSVKYTSIFLIPTTMLLMTLATPLVYTLFPKDGILQALFVVGAEPKFPYAPTFLVISSIVNLFVLFGNVSLATFQTGIGKTKQIMKQSLLSLAISLPFSYAIITYFGTYGGAMSEVLVVIGGILAVMVSTIPGMAWGLMWSWKNYHVKADFKSSVKIFASSLTASIVAYAFLAVFNAPYIILLITGALLFLLVYLVSAPLIGAVNRIDLDNLKSLSSGLGVISKILEIPILFMRKICKEPPPQQNEEIYTGSNIEYSN
ncbi:MAG: oligosaccharide flippase family protein [Candidatus Bathyarchaeota archaeon]|nr:oligosaccharide flippase family protein [Candidatus Termiticorpusculum sp.]